MDKTHTVLSAIHSERIRQNRLIQSGKIAFDCANPKIPLPIKISVLGEEYGEVCRAINDNQQATELYDELVQTATVAVAIAESLLKVIESDPPQRGEM